MDKIKMKAYLDATDGGLDILRRYINTPFEVDSTEVVKSLNKRFTVSYSERYKNYVITIEDWNGLKWCNSKNFNAIWYVKETLNLTENQTYENISYNMDLNIIIKPNDVEEVEDVEEEVLSKESNVTEDTETKVKKQSLLEELMSWKKQKDEENKDDNTSSEADTEIQNNEVKKLSELELKNKLFRDSL